MIKRTRLRKVLAGTKGLRKASLTVVGGLACFILGVSLSFKLVILPFLEGVERFAGQVLRLIVPTESLDVATHMLGGAFLFLGMFLIVLGIRNTVYRIVSTITGAKGNLADVYLRRLQLAQGPRIVALGGGTGLSTLLRGLKQHSSNITAIVTVTDDGGSSGKLIQEKGMIPPGDIRNCLVALADAEKAMTDLFQHRFKDDSGSLSGHSIGNLLIAALVDQNRGDFEQAIARASDVLLIRGRVVPSTLAHVRLKAVLEDESEIWGETNIAGAGKRIRRIFLEPENVEGYAPAIEAIRNADLICVGPGSVFTSVIPNLLVPGITDALRESAAPKVYICNVMTQPGESDSFTASEHVTAIRANVPGRIFDYVMVNTGAPSPAALEKYKGSGQFWVEPDIDRVKAMGFRVLPGDLMSETDVVRHDPMRLAQRLIALREG